MNAGEQAAYWKHSLFFIVIVSISECINDTVQNENQADVSE
jgi:hypothetical protein